MIVEGVAVPVVGRVSMDLATIDLHDVPHAQIGSQVTVMDDDPLSPASAYALSNLANSIPYELFTRIGPRVKRVAVESLSEMNAETRGNDKVTS
jgi:alanine racemase